MTELRFAWDRAKAAANQAKHGVTFAEAQTVFADEGALLIDDPDHSAEEDRFILLGLSAQLRVLVVVHCYRESDSLIRLISARRANRLE
ncbi:MAG TPA: BrnT family toxin, partial [Gemmatimonadales bacterium]|nr:BrnT family toxin [Gemmatimonadales bacterium]